MRRVTTFILAGALTLLVAGGVMAHGYGMRGGNWNGGWHGNGYHMGYGPGYGPDARAQGYGPAYCPGWQAYQNQQPPEGYGPGYGPNQDQRGPANQAPPAAPAVPDGVER